VGDQDVLEADADQGGAGESGEAIERVVRADSLALLEKAGEEKG
jgi:hypothetical protein